MTDEERRKESTNVEGVKCVLCDTFIPHGKNVVVCYNCKKLWQKLKDKDLKGELKW